MANIVRKILIPQICIDSHDWENYTCSIKTVYSFWKFHIRPPEDLKTYNFTL